MLITPVSNHRVDCIAHVDGVNLVDGIDRIHSLDRIDRVEGVDTFDGADRTTVHTFPRPACVRARPSSIVSPC